MGTGIPSLYHVTTGTGMPNASQVMFTLLSAKTTISFGGLTVKLGGSGSRKKNHHNIIKIHIGDLSNCIEKLFIILVEKPLG